MDKVTKSNHCAYDIYYHFVFPVKYRKALFDEEVTSAIKLIAQEIQERFELETEKLGIDINHIHLLCTAHPKYAPGYLARVFKSVTARELFRQFPRLRKDLWGGELWTDGYYVGTIGQGGNWKTVEAYVRAQGQTPEAVQLRLL
jgi:putative transposase